MNVYFDHSYILSWCLLLCYCLWCDITRVCNALIGEKSKMKTRCLVYDIGQQSFFERLSKSTFNVPAPSKNSFIQISCANIYFYFICPFTNRLFLALIGYKTIVISVIRLLFSARPFTVARFIVFVIINSVKCVAFGRFTHVFIKELKVIPPLAVFYTSTTIVFIIGVVGTITSRSHINPRVIYRMSVGVVLCTHESHAMFSFCHAGTIS